MRFAEVAVDVPMASSRTFSYEIPDELTVRPGQLVRVPFGARTLQGIVFSLSAHPQVPETKPIADLVFEEPLLDDVHLKLAAWISEYYICSLFEASAPMLPPGGRVRARTHLTLADQHTDSETLTPLQQRIVEYIAKRGLTTQDSLIKAFGESAASSAASLVRRNILIRDYSLPDPTVKHRYRTHISLSPDTASDINEWLAKTKARKQAAFVEHLREVGEPLDITEARREFGGSIVKTIMDKGWLSTKAVAIDRDPLDGRTFPYSEPLRLTVEQSEAATAIHGAFEEPSALGNTFLIEGVTGSGKTEVYLDAVDCCTQMGKQAIVLVPEIALTYQTIERFASRFPDKVAVLHSGLSDGERFDQWWKIKRGHYSIVIGSRSAIFAPVPDLGLIVVDEEHEWTYKQHDTSPRYHARQVSLRLSELTQSLVVLGSASPDVGSFYAAMRGSHRLHRLTERFADTGDGQANRPSALPSVSVVDMREELLQGNTDMFSRSLSESLSECLELAVDTACAAVAAMSASHITPPRSASSAITAAQRRKPPTMCPQCLRHRLRYYGIGTELVADEVARRYPDAGVLRWDRDIATSPKAHEELLMRFRSGEAQILVGTQMIAKGLHFPSVSLVGVVSADVGLTVPDYRAGERSFQLLHQVAGRAGRGSTDGKVIIQTFQPENYAIQSAAEQDYQAFYLREMAYRRQQGNPPYSSLIRLLYTHANQAKCESEAVRLAGLLREQQAEWGITDVEALGPVPAFPSRLRGRYRWHIILRGPTPRTLLDKVDIPRGWTVDI
ncbi:Primosomal protein N' [Geodia barretti]|uniref:DNA 3'-5' helicase n=1 Tax=Geodia barretti TaxID=519541 RepID=A0AA35WJ93_GEOBA|nr:Primosomal protein N' [Geodia barretti]